MISGTVANRHQGLHDGRWQTVGVSSHDDPALETLDDTERVVSVAEPIDDVADDDAGGDEDDVLVLPWWQNPINIVVSLVAVALIAGMIGWLVGDASSSVKSNDADVGYLQDMWWHHSQAIDMAQTFMTLDDVSPGLVTEAKSIAFGQAQETGMMIQLLRDMDADISSDDGMAMGWMGMPVDPDQMPGMATAEQLDALANASGTEADNLFIDLMTAHHRGGIEMSEMALPLLSNEWVQTYADAWARNQTVEITELERLRPDAA
jgi:uncharacterized protein (DUF305 family)